MREQDGEKNRFNLPVSLCRRPLPPPLFNGVVWQACRGKPGWAGHYAVSTARTHPPMDGPESEVCGLVLALFCLLPVPRFHFFLCSAELALSPYHVTVVGVLSACGNGRGNLEGGKGRARLKMIATGSFFLRESCSLQVRSNLDPVF